MQIETRLKAHSNAESGEAGKGQKHEQTSDNLKSSPIGKAKLSKHSRLTQELSRLRQVVISLLSSDEAKDFHIPKIFKCTLACTLFTSEVI